MSVADVQQLNLYDEVALSETYCRASRMKDVPEWLAERFPNLGIETVEAASKKICINGHSIILKSLDSHGNAKFSFDDDYPLELLRPAAICFTANRRSGASIYDLKYVVHRPVQALLTQYWKLFYTELTADALMDMLRLSFELPCEDDSRRCHGFYAYLMTRSYVCYSGGAIRTAPYRSWVHFLDFMKLWFMAGHRIVGEDLQRDWLETNREFLQRNVIPQL